MHSWLAVRCRPIPEPDDKASACFWMPVKQAKCNSDAHRCVDHVDGLCMLLVAVVACLYYIATMLQYDVCCTRC
jgi:hypothetical protein